MGIRGTTRKAAAVLLVLYSAGLLYILLTPSAEVPTTSISWVAQRAARLGAPDWLLVPTRFEFVLNVLILIPATALGSVVWPRTNWRDWTAYGFVFAAGVELTQGLLLPARSAQFIDVVANGLGAFAGAVLVAFLAALWPTPVSALDR